MPYTFEDKVNDIKKVINSKESSWTLDKLSYISFEDVAQIVLIHVYNKFSLWDQSRPLENWVSTVADHRINNLRRDHYYRTVPPCHGCKMNLDDDLCSFTKSGKQCSECPLYRRWEKGKKNAYLLKMAFSLEEINFGGVGTEFNMEESVKEFNKIMTQLLDEKTAKLYNLLYVECISEDEAAIQMGFKSNENRRPGYKQISNLKKKILETARHIIENYDVIK